MDDKLILFVLFQIISIIHADPLCEARVYCMGCSETEENVCTSCFNFGNAYVKAKSFEGNECTGLLTDTVIGCKYYSG